MKKIDASSDRFADWSAACFRLPNGVAIENVSVNDEAGQAGFNGVIAMFLKTVSGITLLAVAHAEQKDYCALQSVGSAAPAPSLALRPTESAPAAAQHSTFLADWFRQYLDERERGGLASKTLAENKGVLGTLLLGVCDNKPLRDFGVADRDAVFEALKHWPASAGKERIYAELTVKEIIALGKSKQAPLLKVRMIEKYLDWLRTFFRWAHDRLKGCGCDTLSTQDFEIVYALWGSRMCAGNTRLTPSISFCLAVVYLTGASA